MSTRAQIWSVGPLEAEILAIMWDGAKWSSSRDVYEILRTHHPKAPRAYTTVATILNNLYEKRMVRRRKQQRTYLFTPAVRREELVLNLVKSLRPLAGDDETWQSILKEAS